MISLYKLNTRGAGPISFHKFINFGKSFSWYRHSICHYGWTTNSQFGNIRAAYCAVLKGCGRVQWYWCKYPNTFNRFSGLLYAVLSDLENSGAAIIRLRLEVPISSFFQYKSHIDLALFTLFLETGSVCLSHFGKFHPKHNQSGLTYYISFKTYLITQLFNKSCNKKP